MKPSARGYRYKEAESPEAWLGEDYGSYYFLADRAALTHKHVI